jgi:hypothetical protein
MEGLCRSLESEFESISKWWKGASFDDYKDLYDGSSGIKPFLEGLVAESTETCNDLTGIANAKKEFEKTASRKF